MYKPDVASFESPSYRHATEGFDSNCLHEIFEARVDHHPESLALICGEMHWTYRDLDERANRLARCLRAKGAAPGTFVGLYLDRSEHPVIAILACLKAGATYVPIDASWPVDRIQHICAEADPILFLTDDSLGERAQGHFGNRALNLDQSLGDLANYSAARLTRQESGVTPQDLSYVIYTSGTTGRPKGVIPEHHSVCKFARAFNEVCGTSVTDRIYQGFSLGFDGSVEEIWMAFTNGSTLVVPDREAPRFGNELGQYLAKAGITYFSTVPTLLSTITEPIPSLRILVLSGEVCPPELVSRWAKPGLRLFNVYGPTEATVNTTVAECLPGQPVTIGRPLRGYDIYILDPQMRPVAYGEKGELFVGGETLARGYLKQPTLSAERFVTVSGIKPSESTRLYRTGDLVRYNAAGELEFFGRIDSQVKIRGYRVELAEIEAILLENIRVRGACVKLVEREGLQELAAYVVTDDPKKPLDRAEILAQLEARVPPYMVPGFLDELLEFPTLTSGKTDRARLPDPRAPLLRAAGVVIEPKNELETEIAAIWAKIFNVAVVSVEDDFFLDLGGHSLVAAQMVTLLRKSTGRSVTVRDAYGFATVRKLAAHLASQQTEQTETTQASGPTSREVFESTSSKTWFATATAQALSMYILAGSLALPAGLLYLQGLGYLNGQVSLARLVLTSIVITLSTWPVLLILAVAAKWLLIGRYRAGSYPLWGSYYFRWWLSGRIQALSGAGALVGTPLFPLFMRLMGAKVGRGCTLDTAKFATWDLLKIGNETSIGADTQLLGYRIENGMLVLGGIEIGDRCFVGIHSALGLNSKMADDTRLDDQSLLPDGGFIGAGESHRGSPAKLAKVDVPEGMPLAAVGTRAIYGLIHLTLAYFFPLVFLLPSIPFLALWYFAFNQSQTLGWASMAVSVPIGFIVNCYYIVAVKKLILNRVKPGVYSVYSSFYVRKWLVDGLIKYSRAVLLPLYTTLYLPPWLRLMGAKIGARAELSTVWYFSPELIDVGDESFFADGSIIGGKRFNRGQFSLGINRIGKRSFVGNSAILPVGASLGDNSLLGVQSIPPSDSPCTPNGSEWLGSPAFSLPNRPKIGNFDSSLTFQPTTKLYLQRALIDALRILIPGYLALSGLAGGVLAMHWTYTRLGLQALFALTPLIGLALSIYAILAVVGLKKAVMGTFKPVIKPLWSMYVWVNEMMNGAYESVMTPAIAPFQGTPFISIFLRWMGCQIGRRVYLETTLFSEFDLVKVGDYAALNSGAVIQNHLFEDRVMKSSYLTIGESCTVGSMAVVLYDSEMQTGASLAPLSLLMKGETLSARTQNLGIPTQQVASCAKSSLEFHELPARGLRVGTLDFGISQSAKSADGK